MAKYDPRAHGALCDRCPLNGQDFVPPEESTMSPMERMNQPAIAIVGDCPSKVEAAQGRMFAGPAGTEMDKALRMAGIKRSQAHITNVILCNPPGKDFKTFLQKLSKYNRTKPANEPAIPSPIECCAPRLEGELDNFTNFITMGKIANQAVTGSPASIMSVRGALIDLEETERTRQRRVMPTLPPGLLLHQMKYAHVFRNDIAKAGRFFRHEAKFEPPKILWHPKAAALREFLYRPGETYAFDLETDGIDNLTTKIRCIGIGNGKEVALVGLLGKDGFSKFYSREDEAEVIQVLRDYFHDETIPKIAHNGINFDAVVLYNQLGVRPKNIIDTMLAHKSVESELPHSLAYVASIYTDVTSWKSDRENQKLATHAESDEALHIYCATDVAVTHKVFPKLVETVKLRGQAEVCNLDHKIQQVCAEMHMAGMYVDQKARLDIEIKLLKRRQDLLTGIRERLGNDRFNPNSTDQMRDLLFGKWKLTPPLEEEDRFTSSGDPSTADLILRSLLTEELPDDQREIIKRIRYYRKVIKVLGTYVTKLRPSNVRVEDDLGWDDEDEDWIDRETRKKYGLEKTGIVNPLTGRMYPGYSVGTPVTGRLSSSKPLNAQNFPKTLRKMVTAAPGHVLVGADMDQLELRIAAARWNVDLYLRAFVEGKDPHSMTAYAVFGDEFCKAAGVDPACFSGPGKLVGTAYDTSGKFKGEGEAVKLRNLSKAVQYASQYMAKVETVHKLIQKTEVENKDGTTDLPYAKLPLRQVREMHSNWLKGAPEFEAGWEMEINTYRRLGYLAEPITGRRRDFLDGEAPNEIVNFNIQCVPGHVRVITKDGYIPIRELQGKQFMAWTGLRWAPATCISKGTAELREVRTTHAIHLVCDATHKFKVPDRSEYIWKEADDLICNQRVAIDLARQLEFGTGVDPMDAYIVGLFTADGCLVRKNKGRDRGVALSFAIGHTAATGRPERCGDEAIQRVIDWGKSRGLAARLVVEEGHTNINFDNNIMYWCDIWGLNPGLKARDKRIPEFIWRADLAARKQFILGLLDGDAHQSPDGNIVLNMFNPDLLEEVAVLVRTIGIDSMSMHGPYKTNNDAETVSWRLSLSGAHVNRILGWGRECKYRSNNTIPQFECKRIVDRLRPTTASHRTMKSRIKETSHGGAGSITPYSAVEMGVDDLYDHAVTTATVKLDLKAEVYTLCVDDPDHQYVANGFISKNSTAAGLMNVALLKLVQEIPYEKWGPGTGIINQCHDAIVIECPADGCTYTTDEKGKRHWDVPDNSIPAKVARMLEDCLRAEHPSLPGVVFTASADIELSWDKV
jgi:uracil-DNA glycosylase family 4